MPKKVILITSFEEVSEVHAATLKGLFREEIELVGHSFDRGSIDRRLEAELFVFSTYPLYLYVRPWLPPASRSVIIANTISAEQYARLRELPRGSRALLVNYSVEMTMDTISLLRQLGLDQVEYLPFYPGVAVPPGVDLAVTPGERAHVPPSVRRVIDIGHRVIDEKTIVDMAHFLDLDALLGEERFKRYFASVMKPRGGVASLFDLTNVLERQLSGLLGALEDGVVVADESGTVYAANAKALEVLGERGSLVGRRLGELLPGAPLEQVLKTGIPLGDRLVKLRDRDLSLRLVPLAEGADGAGARGLLALVAAFDEREKSQHILRSQLLGKGHRARYDFDRIIGEDETMRGIKLLARRQAKASSSVLIVGETGTGKELFAHAIHEASERRDWQFVTVNCAALPESLLESELFGYAEGAFTGARKGGKPGLFELAHKGTIFLDEIGEMEMGLQARLLRVLESREVMRVGGDSLIHVDIRVIAATNQDLRQRVEEGRFRRDLYYRLAVLPIEVPPLRRRRGDILPVMESLMAAAGARYELDPGARAALIAYAWPGNIRELKNCVEYLACLDKERIEARDLAPVIGRALPRPGEAREYEAWPAAPLSAAARPAGAEGARSRPEGLRPPPYALGAAAAGAASAAAAEGRAGAPDEDCLLFVLGCLYDDFRMRRRSGRRSIRDRAEAANLFLSEAQVRRILSWLESRGWARLSTGRAGSAITASGIERLGLSGGIAERGLPVRGPGEPGGRAGGYGETP